MHAKLARHWRDVIPGPIELQSILARIGKREAVLGLFAAGMRCGNAGIFGADFGDGVALAFRARASFATTPTARLASLT